MRGFGVLPKSPALIIRADANSRSGLGHMMRCLALAQAWTEGGGRAVFLTRCESPTMRRRILKEGFGLEPLKRVHPDKADANALLKLCRRFEAEGRRVIAVVDGYHFNAAFQKKLLKAGIEFLCIDDYGHAKQYWSDWLLNQNASASPRIYSGRAPRAKLLLGPAYALLRQEFRVCVRKKRRIPPRAHKLLVTMGGADPANATRKILEALALIGDGRLDVRILVGPDNPRHAELASLAKSLRFAPGLTIRLISKTDDMPEMMLWADLAVSAGGSTCWEMAALGLPNIILTIAANQIKNAEALARQGISVNLGRHEKVKKGTIGKALKTLISDGAARAEMSRRGRKIVDGSGALKVSEILRKRLL